MAMSISLISFILFQLTRVVNGTKDFSNIDIVTVTTTESTECGIKILLDHFVTPISLECTVSLNYAPNSGPVQCLNETGNSNALIVETSPAVTNISFICSSTRPIYSDVVFEFGVPHKFLSKMKWERVVKDYSDVATYLYQLSIFPPPYTHNSFGVTSVKYNFFNIEFEEDSKIEVLWHFSYGSLPATIRWLGDVKQMKYNEGHLLTEIRISDDYPWQCSCVTPNPDDMQFAIQSGSELIIWYENGNITEPSLPLYYEPFNGFFVTQLIISDEFYCGLNLGGETLSAITETRSPEIELSRDTRENGNSRISVPSQERSLNTNFRFRINTTDFTYRATSRLTRTFNSTQRADKFLRTPFVHLPYLHQSSGETRIVDFKYTQFDLECTSRSSNVTITAPNYDGHLNVTYSSSQLGEDTVYTATCSTPVLEEGSQQEQGFSCDYDDGVPTSIHWWSIEWKPMGFDDTLKLTQDEGNGELRCFTNFTSNLSDVPEIKTIECENLIMCRLLAKCLQDADYGTRTVNCREAGIKSGSPCDINDLTPDSLSRCNAIKPTNKGLVQCKVTDMIFQEIYFIGFDGKLYLGDQSEILRSTSSSILKLNSYNATNGFWPIPGNYSFRCEGHSFYFENGMQWFFQFSDEQVMQIPKENISEIYITELDYDSTNPYSQVDIHIEDTSVVKVICSAPMLSIKDSSAAHKWENSSFEVSLKYVILPTFPEEKIEYELEIGKENQEVHCEAHGFPKPIIHWNKDKDEVHNNTKEDVLSTANGEYLVHSYLMFPEFEETMFGNYSCLAENEAGNTTVVIKVVNPYAEGVNSDSKEFGILPIIIATSSTIFILLVILILLLLRKRAQEIKLLQIKEIKDIIYGVLPPDSLTNNNYVRINPQSIVADNPVQLPYDRNFELMKDSFAIDSTKSLGKGEFGEVFQGRLSSLENYVAFKTVKSKDDISNLKSLASELKILHYIGKHENIVQLLGAYTREIENGVLYVAIELCGLGSLESYLRSNRGRFMQCPVLNCNNLRNTTGFAAANRILKVPLYNSIRCLLKWCTEIANAMDYLTYKKVIHSDLAARNILLTADFVAKITDFGLSRRTYTATEYRKKGQDPLPWRWLAIESLRNLVFTSKTDVWSYGIVLWEIFSLGEVPYPGMDLTNDFVHKLENGLRNSKPEFANRQLYYVMMKCWNSNPDRRPCFASLKKLFENALICDKHTVDIKDLEYQPVVIQSSSYNRGYICLNEDGTDILLSKKQY